MIKSLTIDDTTIVGLLNNPTIVSYLPCLAEQKRKFDEVGPANKECQLCEKKRRIRLNGALHLAKACLSSANGEAIEKIKTYLQTKELKIVFANPSGYGQTYVK